jgi:hypothetical protein
VWRFTDRGQPSATLYISDGDGAARLNKRNGAVIASHQEISIGNSMNSSTDQGAQRFAAPEVK